MKKKYLQLVTLSTILLFSACGKKPVAKENQPSPKDDFYTYVNHEWLEEASIPADDVSYSVVTEMSYDIGDRLWTDIDGIVSGELESNLEGMDEFVSLINVATDFDQRDKDGVKPIKKYLAEIEKVTSLKDLSSVSKDWVLKGLPLPFGIVVDINAENTLEKQLSLSSPVAFLEDVSLYKDEKQRKELLALHQETAEAVLEEVGYSSKESKRIAREAQEFDALIVPYLLSSEEESDITNVVNPRQASVVSTYSTYFDFSKLANDLVDKEVKTLNVSNLNYFENLDSILTEDNFSILKSWLIVQEVMSDAPYLSEATYNIVSEYDKETMGLEEIPDKTEIAYQLALDTFSPVLSVYYGDKYFGEKDKKDVTEMVDNIVDVYKERLSKNEWLSQETKEKAIEKLDKMTYFIGYPEEVPESISIIDIDEDKSLLDNLVEVSRLNIAYEFEHFDDAVDKSEWFSPSYEVNAFYDPTNNSITFPAAILESPFYSDKQSTAENYGAIGAVIGHEITHAFDNNGALFDAEGNMKNWWTEKDFAVFEEKTKAMIEHFDGADFMGHKVNGALTVSENIADAGGLSASLEALKKVEPNANLKDYFEAYATTYRGVVRPEYIPYLLIDTHAPDNIRVNLQVNLLEDFYKTYKVKKGDAMYLPEKKRVNIW